MNLNNFFPCGNPWSILLDMPRWRGRSLRLSEHAQRAVQFGVPESEKDEHFSNCGGWPVTWSVQGNLPPPPAQPRRPCEYFIEYFSVENRCQETKVAHHMENVFLKLKLVSYDRTQQFIFSPNFMRSGAFVNYMYIHNSLNVRCFQGF